MTQPTRLFAPHLGAPGETVELEPDAAHHASVLRLRDGDRVILFDGRGREADAILRAPDKLRATCAIEAIRSAPSPAARVVLIQSMPKGAKLDDIVRACTEAGVVAIHLAIASRSIARPDRERGPAKLDRLLRIAHEAARQSERAEVPSLVAPAPLGEVARRAPASAARIVLSAREGVGLTEALGERDEAWLVVGPEGGLDPDEERALIADGWIAARIRVPILRVETAAPVAVALAVDRLAARRG
jgi:16S rRNA (uracil1498-N3)-methyltransferase